MEVDFLFTLVLPNASSSTRAGCHGADVAEAVSVHICPNCPAPRGSREGSPGWSSSAVSSPVLAGPGLVLRPPISPGKLLF